LCERLKESAATRDIPVLMISGSLTDAQIEAGLPCVTSGLTKPFRPRVLRERVEALLCGRGGGSSGPGSRTPSRFRR
jgi:DNA-binding response OmpR family regulator